MGNPIVSLAADKVGRKTNAALGRANGTIRKSNVRLANLKATGNGRANDQNYQYKYSRLRMCG